MGAGAISNKELEDLSIEIVEVTESGSRKLKIPQERVAEYIELVKSKLAPGFWNEIVGSDEIKFIFKLNDNSIKEYSLSSENEVEIDKLCAELNNEQPDKIANVYKYISENDFYHDFMVEHYSNLINRYSFLLKLFSGKKLRKDER